MDDSNEFVFLARRTLGAEDLRERKLAILQLRQLNRYRFQKLSQTRLQAQLARQVYSQELASVKQARLENRSILNELEDIIQSHQLLLSGKSSTEEAKEFLENKVTEMNTIISKIEQLKQERAILEKTLKEKQSAYHKLSQDIDNWLNKGKQLLI